MPINRALRAFGLALLFLGLALPARAARVVVETAEDFDPARPLRVAFLPLVAVPAPLDAGWVTCPIGGESFVPCKVEEAAEAELSRALGQALMGLGRPVTLVPQSEINAALKRLKQQDTGLPVNGAFQLALGKEVGADAVLTGFIFCYRDRSGGSYASSTPAAIGFCLHLLEVSSGRILWRMRYEDEQRPLFEDLLGIGDFIRRGGQWVSVRRLAEEAAAVMMKKLPWTAARS